MSRNAEVGCFSIVWKVGYWIVLARCRIAHSHHTFPVIGKGIAREVNDELVRRVFGPDEYVEIISTKQSVVSEKARSEFLASRQKYFKIMTGKAEKLRSAEIVCPRCKMSDQTQLIQVLGRMGRVVGQRSSGKR